MIGAIQKVSNWLNRKMALMELRRYMKQNELPYSMYPWTSVHDEMLSELSDKNLEFHESENPRDPERSWVYIGDIQGNFYYTKAHAVQAAYMHNFGFSATSQKFDALSD